MIKNIIFDFGDVFIDLNKSDSEREIALLRLNGFSHEILEINKQYEKGLISTPDIIDFYRKQYPEISKDELIRKWNVILGDFPEHRLQFLENIDKSRYRIFLLSNTNEMHIDRFREQVGELFYGRFFSAFEKVFYSYEVKLRKPDAEIFNLVLKDTGISAADTLFVDDTLENILTAKKMGFRVWHLDPDKEDVTELFTKMANDDLA